MIKKKKKVFSFFLGRVLTFLFSFINFHLSSKRPLYTCNSCATFPPDDPACSCILHDFRLPKKAAKIAVRKRLEGGGKIQHPPGAAAEIPEFEIRISLFLNPYLSCKGGMRKNLADIRSSSDFGAAATEIPEFEIRISLFLNLYLSCMVGMPKNLADIRSSLGFRAPDIRKV